MENVKEKYEELYPLQDLVLEIVNSLENDFYLTGGTALHRFHYDFRYSENLDFFMPHCPNFREDVNEIAEKIEESDIKVETIAMSRDFCRILAASKLRVDFVNDRAYRFGKSVYMGNFRIDNKMNILTNKVGAIVSRDEKKDVFDLICLVKNERFDWKEVLQIVNKKEIFDKSAFIARLKSFPLAMLGNIDVTQNFSLNIDKEWIERLCQEAQEEKENTLWEKKPQGYRRTIKP